MKKIILNISNLWLDANHISQVGHVKNEALQKGSIGPAKGLCHSLRQRLDHEAQHLEEKCLVVYAACNGACWVKLQQHGGTVP